MKVDRPVGAAAGVPAAPTDFAPARITGDGPDVPRINGPVLARVVEAGGGRYVIDLAGERLTLETPLLLKLRQRVELRPAAPPGPGESPPVEIRAVPARSLAFFGPKSASLAVEHGGGPAGPGGASVERTGPVPMRTSVPLPSSQQGRAPQVRETIDGSALEAPLPVPRQPDRMLLRELPAALVEARTVRLPVLEIESPDLHPGEDARLRIVETMGSRALAELKGIRVIVESEQPLRSGQELLCRVAPGRSSLTLRALGIQSPPTEAKPATGEGEPPIPFTIEVRERRLPDFPPHAQVAARVQQTDDRGAVLGLGPVRIRLDNAAGWQPGDDLHVRVLDRVPAPVVEVTPAEPGPGTDFTIRRGMELPATVRRRIGAERYLVELGSRSFEGTTKMSLFPGTELSVRIERTGQQPRLRIIEQSLPIEAVARQILRSHLPELAPLDALLNALAKRIHGASRLPGGELPPHLGPAIEQLHAFLGTAVPVPPFADWLQRRVLAGGLRFEKGLAESVGEPARFARTARQDLKGLLLQVLDVDPEAYPRLEEVQTTARQVLGHLESQQAANLLKAASGEGIRLLIPLTLGGQCTAARLEIRRNRGDGRSSPPASGGDTELLFLLDLEGLGQTQIHARVGTDRLQARFFVEEAASLPFLQDRLVSLAETLERAGYPLVRLEAFEMSRLDRVLDEEAVEIRASDDESEFVRLINLHA